MLVWFPTVRNKCSGYCSQGRIAMWLCRGVVIAQLFPVFLKLAGLFPWGWWLATSLIWGVPVLIYWLVMLQWTGLVEITEKTFDSTGARYRENTG